MLAFKDGVDVDVWQCPPARHSSLLPRVSKLRDNNALDVLSQVRIERRKVPERTEAIDSYVSLQEGVDPCLDVRGEGSAGGSLAGFDVDVDLLHVLGGLGRGERGG